MDDLNPGPAAPGAVPPAASRSGRTKRLVTTIAASAVLLGSGAAIGIALTGGASASTGSAPNTPVASRPAAIAAARCAKLAARLRKPELRKPELRNADHPAAAMRLRAHCDEPLLRLALVGGEHGQVTFRGKTGPKTLAFERGTVESVTGSAITVKALDGTTWTWDLTASTAVLKAGHRMARARLSTGDLVLVGGPVVSGVNDARLIRIHTAA